MRVVEQSAEILSGLSPMEHIEKIGRICYKSEDKISIDSARSFIKMLYKNNHHAMLEHYRFIMEVSPTIYVPISHVKHDFIEMTHENGRYIISMSARALNNLVEDSDCEQYGIMPMTMAGIRDELIGHIVKAYDCYELFGLDRSKNILLSTGIAMIPNSPDVMNQDEWLHHGWRSVIFTTDRGVTHELVRHRVASFAQESTRYCNYSNNKFDNQITVIRPCEFKQYDDDMKCETEEYGQWARACEKAEKSYFSLLDAGVKPQFARQVLPTSTKADIVVTANMKEWKHILELRYYGTTGAPHPMMKELMSKIVNSDEMRYDVV